MKRPETDGPVQVEISNTQGHVCVDPAELAALVRAVLSAEGRRQASISVALVDQAAIHAVNRSHLGHDWPTDVISFPLSEASDDVLAGELVVSGEMAAVTAAEFGVGPGDELALYVVHGLLHLCGYDDLSEADAAVMRRRERELLDACGRRTPSDLAWSSLLGPTVRDQPASGDDSPVAASASRPLTHQPEPSPWST